MPVAPVVPAASAAPAASTPAAGPSQAEASEPAPERTAAAAVPRLSQPESPDRVGVWIGVAALAVVLIAWVWLR